MEILLALAIGLLVGCGVYLVLRARTFSLVLGLTLMSYAVNLFLLASGRLAVNQPPLIGTSAHPTDPLPQALVLTAIVIGFAMTAFVITLALKAKAEFGTDHVDGDGETAVSDRETPPVSLSQGAKEHRNTA